MKEEIIIIFLYLISIFLPGLFGLFNSDELSINLSLGFNVFNRLFNDIKSDSISLFSFNNSFLIISSLIILLYNDISSDIVLSYSFNSIFVVLNIIEYKSANNG